MILPQGANGRSRVSFVHNPSSNGTHHVHGTVRTSSLLGYLQTKKLLRNIAPSHLLNILDLGPVFSPAIIDQTVASADGALGDIFGGALVADASEDKENYEEFVRASQFIVRKMKLAPGEQALVVNGRVSPRWL